MKVAIIGGGLMGTCLAMELSHRGIKSDIIEAGPDLIEASSRYNEGKIHLGFVYVNDPTLATARLQMQGAGRFLPLLRHWLGDVVDKIPVSSRFQYVIHEKTMVRAAEVRDAYKRMGEEMRDLIAPGDYFGIEDPWHVEPLAPADIARDYGPAASEVLATNEVAVDPYRVSEFIRAHIVDDPNITVTTSTKVVSVEKQDRTLLVEGGTRPVLGPFDHVVNCAWGGRPMIDSRFGIPQNVPWSYRMKYYMRGKTSGFQLPSSTMVSGGFGDVVNYGNNDLYLCWYPVGRRGFSTDITPPSWPSELDGDEAETLVNQTLEGLTPILPAAEHARGEFEKLEVKGGVIYALGDTDIDDRESTLHQRSEVGTQSFGWYHTVDTGKYTTAPFFAVQAAGRITNDV